MKDDESGMHVVIVSYTWNWLFQRPQQMATALAESNRVTYWWGTVSWGKVGWRALQRAGQGRVVQRIGQNLTIIASPKLIPCRIADRFPTLDALTSRLQFDLYQLASSSRRPDFAILASSSPFDEMVWERLPARVKIYDCFDEHALFFPGGSPQAARIRQAEERALAHSDLVLATSARLYARLVTQHRRVVMVPNAVDTTHFAPGAQTRVPRELDDFVGPVLGYIGAIERWVDIELIGRVADLLPEYIVVLIGPALVDVSALQARPNVRLLGRRDYAELPAFLQRFDVCMIPFKDNELTRSVDPVKFYEYCAAGKPTVSTPLPTIVERRDLVSIATEAHDFARLVRQARESDTPELRQRRIELALRNSWQARAETILREVAALDGKRGVRPVDRRSQPDGCADL